MRHYKIETIQQEDQPKIFILRTISGLFVFSSHDENVVLDYEFLLESARIRRWVPANMFALKNAGVDLFEDAGEEIVNDEHKHLWEAKNAYDGRMVTEWIECKCKERMKPDEIVRRVNATECLIRYQAMLLAGLLKTEFGDRASTFREYLLSYSDALEEK